jgi:hypothetical protein
VEEFAREMFSATASAANRSIRDMIVQDIKFYEISGVRTMISQALVTDIEDIRIREEEILRNMDSLVEKKDLDAQKEARLKRLAEILEQMAQKPEPKPAKVRNYAMACKPQGVRLAWECNFKHALHSSPCGCAKPQLGGKWVILGKNSRKEIKDDI